MKKISFYLSLLIVCILLSGVNSAHAQYPHQPELTATQKAKIDALMGQMTLDEKLGQLTLFASGWDVTGPMVSINDKKLIKEGKVGAVLNAYTVDYVRELQRMAVEESRLKIPMLFGYDVIHGHRTIFPIPLGQSCSWNMKMIEDAERVAAVEATAEGINWTFSPMVDIARDPRWGRVMEGAGEDPWLGSKVAAARVRGFQGTDLKENNTLLACAKHFVGYGAAVAGRDYNPVDVSQHTLYETYLPPFNACVDAGAATFMTSFNEIAGIPSTCNKWLLTDLLRKEWDFKGFVVTDWTSINEMVNHGIAADNKDAARLALNAGVDMDMVGSTFLNFGAELLKEKKIDMARIDQAVRSVLVAKAMLGLLDDPYRYCNKSRQEKEIMTAKSLDLARKMVSESCVLLKNDKQTLPLPANVKRIAVIGPLADSKKDMLGSWSGAGNPELCVTLLEGLKSKAAGKCEVVYEKGCNTNDQDKSGFDAAVKLAAGADYVILALGENSWMSGEAASRTSIQIPGVQNELAETIAKTGKPVVIVLFNGRPLELTRLSALPAAILESWFGGTQAGNGIADLLFGDAVPAGKLTMTFPRSEGQIPIYYNAKNTGRPFSQADSTAKYVSRYLDCSNEPLYPFGFGLSYTTFAYSNLSVALDDGGDIQVKLEVANTGSFPGEEVVQIYMRDKVASVTRPVKELKGFQKVAIPAGESKKLTLTIKRADLEFYNINLRKVFEPGEFIISAGTNSRDVISKSIVLN